VRRVVISGLGDLELTAKRRFRARQEVGLSIQQALIYGIKLPTGASDHPDVDGGRAAPREQPGTGRIGLTFGYAWDRETIKDTIWASTRLHQDLGGGFRVGLRGELDAAYGYWFRRPNEARELGMNLAFGIHGEFHESDRLGGGRSAGNGHRLLGLQLTPIVTRGNHQVRVGAFVPLVRSGHAEHVRFPVELRFGFETFF
jgi:hypothetical protein